MTSLGFRLFHQPVNLRADNKQAITLIENLEFSRKTKHIEVRWHWIRKNVEQNEIVISYISTEEMLNDGLTKVLSPMILKNFWRMIGITWTGSIGVKGRTYGRSWNIMQDDGRSWKIMEDHRRSWKIMEDHGRLWKIMEDHGRSRKVVENHAFWWKVRSQWPSMTLRWLKTSRNYSFWLRLAQYFMCIRDLKSVSR